MATTTLSTTTSRLRMPVAPVVRTLSPAHAFPYHPSRLETLFFTMPPEIRQQIYNYVFATPSLPFVQNSLKGWRITPDLDAFTYTPNGLQLLSINRRIRDEALPVLYRSVVWNLAHFDMLRGFLNNATMANLSHLHIRKISMVDWKTVLLNLHFHTARWIPAEQGSFIASTLADLPSLREVALSPRHLPHQKEDYAAHEWFALMETLRGNGGVLKIVAMEADKGDWFNDWSLIGGRNFAWCEKILLRTVVEVRTWDELVEGDWGNFDFAPVFMHAMRLNWRDGPLKSTAFEWDVRAGAPVTEGTVEGQQSRTFRVKFWGVPDCVRVREARRGVRREAKQAMQEKRKVELARRGRGSPRLAVEDGFSEGGESGEEVQGGEVDGRARKVVTREEARARRMGKSVR